MVERSDGTGVLLSVPAEVEAILETPSSPYRVIVRLDRGLSLDPAQVGATEITVRQGGGRAVTTASLREVHVGELVDWALGRFPIAQSIGDPTRPELRDGVDGGLIKEARQMAKRRSGKPGRVLGLEQVADVANSAERRGLDKALRHAFPDVGRATIYRVLREAREEGLVQHTTRSRGQGKP